MVAAGMSRSDRKWELLSEDRPCCNAAGSVGSLLLPALVLHLYRGQFWLRSSCHVEGSSWRHRGVSDPD